jgi:hypothetical protein
MDVGAATIASTGAAVDIENVFNSLIIPDQTKNLKID